jgi:hypothetical protein
VRKDDEHADGVKKDISIALLHAGRRGRSVKALVNAELLNHDLDIGTLKINQLWGMCEAISDVFNETKIVTMLLRNKPKRVC